MTFTREDLRMLDVLLAEAKNPESPLGKMLGQTEMYNMLRGTVTHGIGPLEEYFNNIEIALQDNSELLYEVTQLVSSMREAAIASSQAHQCISSSDAITSAANTFGGMVYKIQ